MTDRRRSYLDAHLTADGRVRPVRAGDGDAAPEADRSQASDPALVAAIREEIQASGGQLTFARFMELALYHPERGYYVTSEDRPTRAGDFLTAPEVHPMFGRLLARQLDEMWQRLDRPASFVIREYGAGRGVLGEAIARGLGAEGSDLLGALRYEPLEVPGRTAAAERLTAAGYGELLAAPGSEAARGGVTGCLIANELLDALPVHRVGVRDGTLVEWHVTWRDGWFREAAADPSTPDLARYLDEAGVELREGQRAEIGLAARDWVRHVAATLASGYLLLMDYGYPAPELYGPQRHGGTLRAFRGHHVGDDPFRAVGAQDLTAHVDLTTVERAARGAGLELLGRTTQAEFLIGLGLGELLQAIQGDPAAELQSLLSARAAAARFIDPGALGGFAVLVFGRGVAAVPPLRGLGFRIPGLPRAPRVPRAPRAG